MVIEAFDKNGTKYKVGQEVIIKDNAGLWHIINITLDDNDKAKTVCCINKDMTNGISTNISKVTLTGAYEPDILKLKRKLAK